MLPYKKLLLMTFGTTVVGHYRSVACRLKEGMPAQYSVGTHNSSVVSSLCLTSLAPNDTSEEMH